MMVLGEARNSERINISRDGRASHPDLITTHCMYVSNYHIVSHKGVQISYLSFKKEWIKEKMRRRVGLDAGEWKYPYK